MHTHTHIHKLDENIHKPFRKMLNWRKRQKRKERYIELMTLFSFALFSIPYSTFNICLFQFLDIFFFFSFYDFHRFQSSVSFIFRNMFRIFRHSLHNFVFSSLFLIWCYNIITLHRKFFDAFSDVHSVNFTPTTEQYRI